MIYPNLRQAYTSTEGPMLSLDRGVWLSRSPLELLDQNPQIQTIVSIATRTQAKALGPRKYIAPNVIFLMNLNVDLLMFR